MRARMIVAAVLVMTGAANAQTHAPWPTDWNNWNDPALWCTVGDPGNAADGRYPVSWNSSLGNVNYTYGIGKFEVTAGQYTAFLNAVAATDSYALYHQSMADATWGSGITRNGSLGSYTYSVDATFANRPVNCVTWGDAARFANWLTNGQPTGTQGLSTTEDGSYNLTATQKYYGPDGSLPDDFTPAWYSLKNALTAVKRKVTAKYVIPTENEWYKAAYYKGGGTDAGYWTYPTRSDTSPGSDQTDAGGQNANVGMYDRPIDSGKATTLVGEFQNTPGPYGTFDQAGNVTEWTETNSGNGRCMRGMCFLSLSSETSAYWHTFGYPTSAYDAYGIRIALVPEPATLSLLALGGLALLRKRRK